MIDNFDKIDRLLSYDPDHFYFGQIMIRAKDDRTVGSNNKILKDVFITHKKPLLDKKSELISFCNYYETSRFYLNLNKRNYYKTSLYCLSLLAERISKGSFVNFDLWTTASGRCVHDKEKKWIVDIDNQKDFDSEYVKNIIKDLSNIRPVGDKFLACLPTKNGLHLITKPFDKKQFSENYTEDIHTNNPTLVYMS